eukprot:GEMP01018226.1.p1 GENE.GEMP01018226.1~~GEMP01018226.1.p1  ORF type:complete len:379 (+),score=51.69 GEMP01018226.1:157-1137(+)
MEDSKKIPSASTEVTQLKEIRLCVRKAPKHFTLELMNRPHRKGKNIDFYTATCAENQLWTIKVETLLAEQRSSPAGEKIISPLNDQATQATTSPSTSSSVVHPDSGRVQSSTTNPRVGSFDGPTESQSSSAPSKLHTRDIRPEALQARQLLRATMLEPGTRVRFGQMQRYGTIEQPFNHETGKFMVRVEGKACVLPLSVDILSSCTEDDLVRSVSTESHEPPPPQHLATELRHIHAKKEEPGKKKKINYALRHLMVEKYTEALCGKDSDETEKECSICCMDYEDGDMRLRLPCFHVFHDECVRPWLRDKSECCPVCNISVVEALAL